MDADTPGLAASFAPRPFRLRFTSQVRLRRWGFSRLTVAQIIGHGPRTSTPTSPERRRAAQGKRRRPCVRPSILMLRQHRVVAGAAVAALLTASNYSGRTLGRSETRSTETASRGFYGANVVAAKEIHAGSSVLDRSAVETAHERTGLQTRTSKPKRAKTGGDSKVPRARWWRTGSRRVASTP
jgi:hypothetical protein